jgi:hypothetical protein
MSDCEQSLSHHPHPSPLTLSACALVRMRIRTSSLFFMPAAQPLLSLPPDL